MVFKEKNYESNTEKLNKVRNFTKKIEINLSVIVYIFCLLRFNFYKNRNIYSDIIF